MAIAKAGLGVPGSLDPLVHPEPRNRSSTLNQWAEIDPSQS